MLWAAGICGDDVFCFYVREVEETEKLMLEKTGLHKEFEASPGYIVRACPFFFFFKGRWRNYARRISFCSL